MLTCEICRIRRCVYIRSLPCLPFCGPEVVFAAIILRQSDYGVKAVQLRVHGRSKGLADISQVAFTCFKVSVSETVLFSGLQQVTCVEPLALDAPNRPEGALLVLCAHHTVHPLPGIPQSQILCYRVLYLE
jgi:hypothetical protein